MIRHAFPFALGLELVLPTGCVVRPCQCKCLVGQCPQTAQAASAERPLASFAPKALLVWDGEGTGAQAKGWASCQQGSSCTTSVDVKPGAGHNGSNGLEFKAKGPEWMGFGWNWFGWYPPTAGTDISKHKSLDFWIKISGAPGKKPESYSVAVSLQGSSKGGKDETETLKIGDYAKGFDDGEWHKVVLPLDPMLHGKGESFDTSRAWSITIGAWNQGEREYTIQVDEIEFS